MSQASALREAHDDIVAALREHLERALALCEGETLLVPLGMARNLFDALRELDRMEAIGRDWEQALDGLVAMVHEGSADEPPADEPS